MEQYYLRQLRACQPISLQQLLDAKEARVLRQQRMMQQQSGTLISFTLNIAGGVKSFPLFSYAFALGKECFSCNLQAQKFCSRRRSISRQGTSFAC